MNPWLIAGGIFAALAVLLTSKGDSSTGAPLLLWNGESYRVTPSDRLWLLRAVQSESNKADDRRKVAQTLINRFVFLKGQGSTAYPTLTKFLRAYSQPINPKWEQRGTAAQIEKRRIARNRSVFSDTTVFAVNEALTKGMTQAHRSSVHYAAPGVRSKNIRLTPDRPGYNTYWAVSTSRRWPGYAVA